MVDRRFPVPIPPLVDVRTPPLFSHYTALLRYLPHLPPVLKELRGLFVPFCTFVKPFRDRGCFPPFPPVFTPLSFSFRKDNVIRTAHDKRTPSPGSSHPPSFLQPPVFFHLFDLARRRIFGSRLCCLPFHFRFATRSPPSPSSPPPSDLIIVDSLPLNYLESVTQTILLGRWNFCHGSLLPSVWSPAANGPPV